MPLTLRPATLTVLLPLLACGDSGSGGAGGGTTSAGPTGATSQVASSGSGTATASTSAASTGSATGATGGSTSSGAACEVPDPVYDDKGCLTFESAGAICGFMSDDAICTFSVGCGVSEDVSQCRINCEQGSVSFCNDMTMTSCVLESFCAKDCARLATCGFIL